MIASNRAWSVSGRPKYVFQHAHRATDAERELSQARTTLARTPSEDARRAFHSELEAIRETARERLTRAEAAEGELAAATAAVQSVSRKLAEAQHAADAKQAVYASGLADRDAKLKDLEATLRRLRTQAAPSSVAVQSELAARDRTIDALQRECTLAQAALEAANAEVAASRAAQRRDGAELADARRALQTPRTFLRSPLDDELSRERSMRLSIEAERDELLRTARNLADAVTPGAYDGDDESSLDDPPSLIEELESARKRAMDDDARVRDEVASLKAALRRSESSLNEEVEKRAAAERELQRAAERRPSTPSEIRSELEGVKAAARSAFGAVRALRARSPVESDPERAFYAREDRRAAAARLDAAERSLAPDASPSERAAARLDAAEPVLRPAASPRFSEIDLDADGAVLLDSASSEEGDDNAPFATPVHNLQAATDAFARLLASAESAVAAAEKEPTPRTVRATRDLNPQTRDLLTWGRDRRSMSVGTAPVRPPRGPREHAPSPQPRRVTRNVVVSPTTVVDAARIQRARMLGELCYTIPGSSLPADRKRAERFATQYLGVTA